MATIGTFTKDGETFTGTIETLTLKANILIEPNAHKGDNAKSPDYRIVHHAQNFRSEIGAAWKRSKDGAAYLSVSLDDPSFPEKINCRLVKTGSEQGHTLFWDRQRPRD
jgi:uncharacterized protein (DUF736 family)